MSRGLTKKLDYEKGKRQTAAQNPDYRERFQDEGQNYDRGGKSLPKLISFRGRTFTVNRMPFYNEDKRSLIRTLQGSVRFVIGDQTGTIGQLRKIPHLRDEIAGRFDIIKRAILRAEDIVGVARHPKLNRDFYVVEFRCCLKPAEPFPNPLFKDYLAFSMQLVGPALTGS
jgi:hypothetical protein